MKQIKGLYKSWLHYHYSYLLYIPLINIDYYCDVWCDLEKGIHMISLLF